MEEGHQRFRCIFATIQFESAGHLVVEFTDNLWDLLQICSTEKCPICLCPQSAPEPEFLKILEPKHGIRSSTGWFRKHRGTGWCGRPHCDPEAWYSSAKPMAQLQLFVVLVVGLVLSQVKEQTETQMSATRAEQKHLDIWFGGLASAMVHCGRVSFCVFIDKHYVDDIITAPCAPVVTASLQPHNHPIL